MTPIRALLAGSLATALMLTACSDDDPTTIDAAPAAADGGIDAMRAAPAGEGPPGPVDDGPTVTAPDPDGTDDAVDREPVERDGPTGPPARSECRPGPGRTVTHLDPVVIPEVDVPAQWIPSQELEDGSTIPGGVIEGFHIPEQVVDTGCIIEHDAPAGCLGAVEITGFEIPPVEIPRAAIPGLVLRSFGDEAARTARGSSAGPVVSRGVEVDGVRRDQVCQIAPSEEGDFVAAVHRPVAFRPVGFRPVAFRRQLFRPVLFRPATCEGSRCVDSVTVDSVTVPSVTVDSVTVDSVTVPSATLPSYTPGGTDTAVAEAEDETAYAASNVDRDGSDDPAGWAENRRVISVATG